MRAYEDWVIEAETKGLKISEVILRNQMEELEQSEQTLFQTAQGGLAMTLTGRRIQADLL